MKAIKVVLPPSSWETRSEEHFQEAEIFFKLLYLLSINFWDRKYNLKVQTVRYIDSHTILDGYLETRIKNTVAEERVSSITVFFI